MMYIRSSEDRGTANFGWLHSRHSFSFGHYYDPRHMGISALRVINDDEVAPGAGFDTHGHRDMEIISYILEGAIEHKDSMGNQFIVPAGEVQRMSAGTGITHSEFNHSSDKPLKFLQIWIQPNQTGIQPSYEQKAIAQSGKLTPLVTPDGRDGSLSLHQNAEMHRLVLNTAEQIQLLPQLGCGYLHIIEGKLTLDSAGESIQLTNGDAVGIQNQSLDITAESSVTALWFDLPGLRY